MCGEHGEPLVQLVEERGIIPACAGSTLSCWQSMTIARDHPRMCGEHGTWYLAGANQTGSSPHVRGALSHPRGSPPRPGDHPRMCGEHRSFSWLRLLAGIIPACAGSTVLSMMRMDSRGIIPACAGSTRFLASRHTQARDHPRMCGEHHLSGHSGLCRPGSSPHVRGAPGLEDDYPVRNGIIPACAGSTYPSKRRAKRDHPRMCGEHE